MSNEVKIIEGLIALDWVFNEGKVTKWLVTKAVEIHRINQVKTKTVYVLKDELVDMGFGC